MKTKLILSLFLLSFSFVFIKADEYSNYREWEHEDVVAAYEEVSKEYAKGYGFDEVYEDRYFIKVNLEEGIYKVEVRDKVDSKFWGIAYSKFFIKFRYNPYLYNFDEGVLEWSWGSGVFYKKP